RADSLCQRFERTASRICSCAAQFAYSDRNRAWKRDQPDFGRIVPDRKSVQYRWDGLSRIYVHTPAGLPGGPRHSCHLEPAATGWKYSLRYCVRNRGSPNSFQMKKEEVLPPIEKTIGAAAMPLPSRRSASILRKRIRKFTTLKRGYYSFVILVVAY